MARPVNLVDKIHDFGESGNIPLYIPIEASAFSTKITNSSVRMASIQQKMSIGSGTPVLQTQAGYDSPPAVANTIIEARTGTNNYANVFVTVKDINSSNINSTTMNCRVDYPQRWQSDFYLYYNPFNFGAYYIVESNWPAAPMNTHEYYIFKVFQKSVAIIEDLTANAVVNGQTKTATINSVIRVSKAKSRGKDLSSSFSIQVKDSSGNFVSAVQGSDYSITFGSLSSDVLEIQVTQPKVFRILNKIAGFTSSNNTYPGTGTGGVSLNEDSTFYILDVQGELVNTQDIITLPKISPSITIQNQTTSNPNPTGYSGASISVIGLIDIASGSYNTKDLNTGIVTSITMTEAQWIQELSARTNISLEIKYKTNSQVLVTKTGLGPHTNISLPIGDFIAQFKTTLK